MPTHNQTIIRKVGIPAALLICLLPLLPGINSGFSLDDFNNLAFLGSLHHWQQLLATLLSVDAGPTHRPISLLSFALQAKDWPNHPAALKLVNLLLHGVNGLLVYALLRELKQQSPALGDAPDWLPWLAAAAWLLSPLQTSTVFYTVQRMTELAATFTFAALLCWLSARNIEAAAMRRLLLWLGFPLCGLLGLLSKENAALLPLLVLVIRTTLLRRTPQDPKSWSALMLWVPAGLLLAILFWYGWLARNGIIERYGFSIGQRLLTEPRVLLDYLQQIILPLQSGISLYHDDYPPSLNLAVPWTTLPAILIGTGLLIGAWALRQRQPVLAFGLLWFFAGQLMESTVLPLELYFDHRNYLPLLGPAVALLYYLSRGYAGRERLAVYTRALAWLWVGLLAITSLQISLRWQQPLKQAVFQYRHHPNSFRAFSNLVLLQTAHAELPAMVKTFIAYRRHHPQEAGTVYLQAYLSCLTPALPTPNIAALMAAAHDNRQPYVATNTLQQITALQAAQACPGIDQGELRALLTELTTDERIPGDRRLQFYQLLLHNGALPPAVDYRQRMRWYKGAAALSDDPTLFAQGFADAMTHGDTPNARYFLLRTEHYCTGHPIGCLPYRDWLERMRNLPQLKLHDTSTSPDIPPSRPTK